MDVSPSDVNDKDTNLSKFLTADELRTLNTIYNKLPILLHWEIEFIIDNLCDKLAAQERKIEAITGNITELVIKSNELFNKWDTF